MHGHNHPLDRDRENDYFSTGDRNTYHETRGGLPTGSAVAGVLVTPTAGFRYYDPKAEFATFERKVSTQGKPLKGAPSALELDGIIDCFGNK